LAFLHRFQERRLGAGGGAIDFVHQHQRREQGSGSEFQALLAVTVAHQNFATGDIRRHQIRRALECGASDKPRLLASALAR